MSERKVARRRHTRSYAAAAAAASALMLAGCATGPADGPPTVRPTTTPVTTSSQSGATASSSPSASVTPTVPAAARANTVEGAQEFVTYVIGQINLAYRTADPTVLDAVFAPDCLACSGIRDVASQLKNQGQRAASDAWVGKVVVAERWSPGSALISATISQARTALLDKEGRPVSEFPAESALDFKVTLRFGEVWVVDRWQGVVK